MNGRMSIAATVKIAGLHHWPGAHGGRNYLAHPHRHLFWFTAEVAVWDDDRAVEWHDLAHMLTVEVERLGARRNGLIDFGAQSCEMLARALATTLVEVYGLAVIHLAVSEDGEFTAHLRAGG